MEFLRLLLFIFCFSVAISIPFIILQYSFGCLWRLITRKILILATWKLYRKEWSNVFIMLSSKEQMNEYMREYIVPIVTKDIMKKNVMVTGFSTQLDLRAPPSALPAQCGR